MLDRDFHVRDVDGQRFYRRLKAGSERPNGAFCRFVHR